MRSRENKQETKNKMADFSSKIAIILLTINGL